PRPTRVALRKSADRAVPAADDLPLVLVPQQGERGGVQREQATARGRQPDPPGPRHPQCVSVPDQGHMPPGKVLARAGEYLVQPRAHLLRGLAAGAAVGPQVPVGPGLADLDGTDALVLAVVPLHEVLVDLRDRQAGDLGGTDRTKPGAA